MAQIDDLKTAIAGLTAAVNALIAKVQTAPEDLTQEINDVNALTASVNAAVTPPA